MPGPYVEHVFGDKLQEMYSGHRGWVTCAVHHSIPWPEKDVAITYNNRQYFLRGLKENSDDIQSACITVRMNSEQNINNILKDVYRFTSILGWFKRGYVDVVGYTNGSHAFRYGSGNQMFIPCMANGIYGFNCNYMPLITEEAARLALAFWREGLKLEQIHESYSFLSFYKVIESQFVKGKDKGQWITNSLHTLTGKAKQRIEELEAEGVDVSKHIFESGRCAVAHATFGQDIVDPDIPEDKIQIKNDLDIIKALADKYIREELGIPDEMDVFRNRNNLEPVYEYFSETQIQELTKGGSILRNGVALSGLLVSVNKWPHPPALELSDLEVIVNTAHNGIVCLSAVIKGNLCLSFVLDFTKGKAHTNLNTSGYLSLDQGGLPSNAIAFLNYMKDVIGNGIIEIEFPNGGKVTCEVVIPVNIDINRTFTAIDQQISEMEKLKEKNK